MRMIKIIKLLTAFLITTSQIIAQDTTKPFYFPHNEGDVFQYLYYDGPMYIDTLQNFTISDSTDSQGIIHIIQHAQFINPTERAVILDDTMRLRIDTVNNYVYGPQFEAGYDSLLIYKLDAQKREKWVLGENRMARVKDRWQGFLFDKNTTFMSIYYYTTEDTTDTIGTGFGTDIIADGFGLIFRGGDDLVGEINMTGAVINKILYGDTTVVVSAKDKNKILPIMIRLNQNYPNPFNPTTTISFELKEQTNISLIIYNILGSEVLKLIDDKNYRAGGYEIKWNGLNKFGTKAAGGVYFYMLITLSQALSRSMILLK